VFLGCPFLGRRDELGRDEGAGECAGHVLVAEPQGLDGLGLGRQLRQGLLVAEHGDDAGHGRAGHHGVLGGQERNAEHLPHLLLVAGAVAEAVAEALVQHVQLPTLGLERPGLQLMFPTPFALNF